MSHIRKSDIEKAKRRDPDRIVFHLAAHAPANADLQAFIPIKAETMTLFEQIKSGKKRSEYRFATKYWESRLLKKTSVQNYTLIRALGIEEFDLTKYLKVKRAWFVQGYPKNCLPRLEIDIVGLVYLPLPNIFVIKLGNVIDEFPSPEEILEGHGLTEIVCVHAGRFVWWWDEQDSINFPLGKWMNVVKPSNCDCGEPPSPFKTIEEIRKYLAKNKDVIQTVE